MTRCVATTSVLPRDLIGDRRSSPSSGAGASQLIDHLEPTGVGGSAEMFLDVRAGLLTKVLTRVQIGEKGGDCIRQTVGVVRDDDWRLPSTIGESLDAARSCHNRLLQCHTVQHLHPHASANAHGRCNN